MASRKSNKVSAEKVLAWVAEFDGVSTGEVAEQFDITDHEANDLLVALENEDKIASNDEFRWVATETPDDGMSRVEYMARVAESQDMDFSQIPSPVEGIMENMHGDPEGSPVLPAETPVIAEDGSKVTIPVDFDDPSKGRRELDADKGEKLLSEDVITVKATPARLPDKGLDQFVDDETGDMVYESAIEKNGLKLDEPAEVPPCPAGVNANVWDLANTAVTQTARDYWAEVARLDAKAYAANKGAPAPF